MAKVNQTLDNLFGGVSRRPQEQRHPSQADEQVNMLSLFGSLRLSRRPPLEHIAKIMSTTTGYATAFVEEIRRSDSEKYIFIIINGDLKVFNASTGVEQTVVFPNAKAYLTGATDGFRAVTVGENTIITNRTMVTRKGTSRSAAAPKEALLYVRQGDYKTKYIVTLDGNTVTHETPASARETIATDYIATAIRTAMLAVPAINNNFTITRYGSTLHIVNSNSSTQDFALTAQDGLADQALIAIKGTVQRFTDLPTKAKPNFIVEVRGDDSTKFDNYFVQYTETGTPGESGTWKEVVEPDTTIAFDKSTMPHRLKYKGDYLATDVAQGPAAIAPTIAGTANSPVYTFDAANTYAPGVTISAALESASYVATVTYTNSTSAYVSAATMCAGLNAAVHAHASFNVVASTSLTFTVNTVAGLENIDASSSITYDRTRRFANSTLAMTVDEHVGRTLRNLTDGSTATITSNTAVSIFCTNPLTGGSDNQFAVGDLVNIQGTGVYFVFSQTPWVDRAAGSLTTVPFPSFVDRAVTEVFEHQGRLGFLAGPNVVLSRAGADNLFNLFRRTATQLLADDVIDFKSALSSSPMFDSAVNWNGVLLLKSDKGQFEMTGEPALSPTTVSLRQIGEYQAVPALPTVVLGSSAFFLAARSSLPQLWDFRVRGPEALAVADDVTADVPGYVAGTPLQMEADDSHGLLYLRTSASPRYIYVYATQYVGSQRAQAAWSRWEIGSESEVVSVQASRGQVFVVTKDANGLYLHSAMLAQENNPAQRNSGVGHVFLDRLITEATSGVTVGYSGGITTWTLPYSISTVQGKIRVVRKTSTGLQFLTTFRSGADNHISFIGDASAYNVYIGVAYESRYRLSRVYRRGQEGRADTRGNLLLSWLTMRFEDTMSATVDMADSRSPWYLNGAHLLDGSVRLMPTRTVSVFSSTLESDTEQRFHIGANAKNVTIEIVTEEPGPMNLSSISWEGEQHDNRGAP